jgi:hypothetical protein
MRGVPRLGIDVFALSFLGVTSSTKTGALQATFDAATHTVKATVRTCLFISSAPRNNMYALECCLQWTGLLGP